MVALWTLPPELLIHILSNLPVPDLVVVPRLSKYFSTLFTEPQNEILIWRNVCHLHGLIGDGNEPPRREWGRWHDWRNQPSEMVREMDQDAEWAAAMDIYSSQSFVGSGISDDEVNWKALLKRRLEIHRAWAGELPSDTVRYRLEDVRFSTSETRSYMPVLDQAAKLVTEAKQMKANILGATIEEIEELEDSTNPYFVQLLETASEALGIDPISLSTDIEKVGLVGIVSVLPHVLCNELDHVFDSLVPSAKHIDRMKVDERNGYIVSTQSDGGLIVTDITSKEILWCLPKNYVGKCANLEYEKGYIILGRSDGSKEVWRSSSLPPPREVIPLSYQPDKRQRLASALANGNDNDLLRSFMNEAEATDVSSEFQPIASVLRRRRQSGRMGVLDAASIASALGDVDDDGNATMSEGFDSVPGDLMGLGCLTLEDLRRTCAPHIPFTDLPSNEASGSGGPEESNSRRMKSDAKRLSPHFVPHMIIPVPLVPAPGGPEVSDPTTALRFAYPHLLCASSDYAYVWDIRSRQIVQVLPSLQTFAIPKGYPMFATTGLNGDVSRPSPAKTGEVPREKYKGDFPAFRPFESGFFDQNSVFSCNAELVSSLNVPPINSGTPALSMKGDPLSLRTDFPAPLKKVTYVELGECWIFVCGEEGLRGFPRGREFFDETQPKVKNFEPGQIALRILSDKLHYARWGASLGMASFRAHWGSELVQQEVVWDEDLSRRTEEEANMVEDRPAGKSSVARQGRTLMKRRRLHDRFIAVHVSPDQKHLAALLSSSRLVFVPWFERVVTREVELWDVALDIQLGGFETPSVCLSYGTAESGSGGSAGRISVATKLGIFVITPYFKPCTTLRSTTPARPPTREVDITVHRLAPSFMDVRGLGCVSCLQMSDTGLWVNWTIPEPRKGPLSAARASWQKVFSPHGYTAFREGEGDWDYPEAKNDAKARGVRSDGALGAVVIPAASTVRLHMVEGLDKDVEVDKRTIQGGDQSSPVAATEGKGDNPILIQAHSSGGGPGDASSSSSLNAKGKDRQVESAKEGTWWALQGFNLEETPPSQFQVKGGKCKWNSAEFMRLGGNARTASPFERRAIECEFHFQSSLRIPRIVTPGSSASGAVELPNGDLAVKLAGEYGLDKFFGAEEERCELRQIRFVPI
ncbi:hypothetical protein DFP72DRAFT_887154 [Ephemerocybe angulata]|uniref:F-box domain-containing protein n=1 Tax=Ephemerocybe angulata TaxID=980116 RepID=A0A8H6I4X5_9AGAR|nr:hypothetical protein DFP72DRAFT_887154 [Tulosesus angulatus]